MVEQLTLNQRAVGSTPTRPTKTINHLHSLPLPAGLRVGSKTQKMFSPVPLLPGLKSNRLRKNYVGFSGPSGLSGSSGWSGLSGCFGSSGWCAGPANKTDRIDQTNQVDHSRSSLGCLSGLSCLFRLSCSSHQINQIDQMNQMNQTDSPRRAFPASRALLALCPTEIHHSLLNIQHFAPPGPRLTHNLTHT